MRSIWIYCTLIVIKSLGAWHTHIHTNFPENETRFAKPVSNRTRNEIQFIVSCWTLNPHSCTTEKHQTHDYRWSSLLSQMAFCWPCQTTEVHYRDFQPVKWHWNRCEWCQTAANYHLNLFCGLSLFLSLTVDTALLSMS